MVVTCKVFLDIRRQKKDKTYPLKIRITVDRKTKEIPLSLYLLKEQWDFGNNRVKPSHPNAKLISVRINQKMTEIQEKALKYENADHVFTADDLKTAAVRSKSTVSFYDFAQQEIESLNKSGRVGNAITYRTATNRLIKFTGKEQIRFENIDYRLLEDFNNHLLGSGLKPNAIASYMREIRAIYNKALKTGIVEQKYYPFNKFKIKTTRTISRALTIDEMKAIVKLEIEPNTPMWQARNYFLLSFCLIGINFTDMFLLKPKSIVHDRIFYSRKKTKKIYSVSLTPQAKQILSCYYFSENEQTYLLPLLHKDNTALDVKKLTLQAIKTTNKYLGRLAHECGIKEQITTYYARYAWANIAKGLGFSKDLIAEALGHEYGNKVTGIYLDNYSNEIIDNAHRAVIQAIFN